MKKLSIITINYNNSSGLQSTMKSVFCQTEKEFEYIIMDGGSTDGSVEYIKQQEKEGFSIHWFSEPDNGIYNAMNKALKIATGEYVQFLNSGDTLINDKVVASILSILNSQMGVSIFYGIEKQIFSNNKIRYTRELAPTMYTFYKGTIPHSAAFIRRSLFDKYGYYDETLKIVSDWKWYIQSIVLGGEIIQFIPIEITNFDKQGISSINHELDKEERDIVLSELLPKNILRDYEKWSFSISQLERINRYKVLKKMLYFCERFLFKIEKFFK